MQDALILEIAMRDGYVLLTADDHMNEVATRHRIAYMYWSTGIFNDRFFKIRFKSNKKMTPNGPNGANSEVNEYETWKNRRTRVGYFRRGVH